LHQFDPVIQSKPEVGWYVQSDEQTVVRYVHHGFRRHYSQYDRMGGSLKNRLWSTLFRTVSRQTLDYPELLVCNSETTAQRMRDQFAVREDRLRVCYPPVDVERYGPEYAEPTDQPTYLSLGRLADNKALDEVVDAFAGRDERLLIAGDGPERPALEREAAPQENIEFLGYVDEHRKRTLLASADGFVMNAHGEDFGIAPIEALASGTPVLGVDEPFTTHQVIDGVNGVTYDRGAADLGAAVDRIEREGVEWSAQRIAKVAERFSTERFRATMHRHLREAEDRTTYEPHWLDELEPAAPGDESTEVEVVSDD
jgi:glycosyltransferase involved in cell wall biosynthesis